MVEPNLKSHLKGKVAILGFGNRLWGDDGAGSVLAELLQQAVTEAAVFDGGMVPENYLEKVAATDPDEILLIDSADFGGEAGEWRIFSGEDLSFTGFSTHAGSPRLLAAYLEERTGAKVALLALQPGDTAKSAEFSPLMELSISELAQIL